MHVCEVMALQAGSDSSCHENDDVKEELKALDLVQTPNGYKTGGGARSHQYMYVIQMQAMVGFPLLHFVLLTQKSMQYKTMNDSRVLALPLDAQKFTQ